MKQRKAPETTREPQQSPQTKSPSLVFITLALDMSWRLAIVVLVPMIGGFKLDEALGMTPVLTIVGFLLAMGGMALVMWQTVQKANEITATPKKEERDHK